MIGLSQYNSNMFGACAPLMRNDQQRRADQIRDRLKTRVGFMACSAIGDIPQTAVNSFGTGSTSEDVFDDSLVEEAGITTFLQRRVKIKTYTWAVGANFQQSIEPWNEFVAIPIFKEKLNHYNLVKCDFKITIYTKGTKFHAGLLLASVLRTGVDRSSVLFSDAHLVTYSQRPHVDLEVGTSQTGELMIPFIYPLNWRQLIAENDETCHGTTPTVDISSYTSLKGAGTTDSVTVTVFLEAVNLKLAAPTANTVGLSGESAYDPRDFFACDEYTTAGPVSSVASAVASASRMLVNVPVIGRFARASEITFGAVAGIARLFGYSKPPILDNLTVVRQYPISSLSLMEGGDTCQKMTMTAKQELSIDPGTVGLPSTDEMSIDFIKKTESYVTNFEWAVTHAVDDIIFQCHVDPMISRRHTNTVGYTNIPTALSFVSRPFAAWTGSITYRLQVIACSFHTGRLAVIYEPSVLDPSIAEGADYNTNFYFVIDLAETRDVTFTVTWKQGVPYKLVRHSLEADSQYFSANGTPVRTIADQDWSNGVWYVRVLNELVVPDGTTNVRVVMKVKGGDDFALANPTGKGFEGLSVFPYVAASSESIYDPLTFFACSDSAHETDFATKDVQIVELAPNDCQAHCEKPLVFYGETVSSVRQLIKRYGYYRTLVPSSGSTSTSNDSYYLTQFPLYYGHCPHGVDTVGPVPANLVGTTMLNYFAPAYGMWRGGVRYKVVTSWGTILGFIASRALTAATATFHGTSVAITNVSNDMNISALTYYSNSLSGSVATTSTVPLEFEVPYAERVRASWVYLDHNIGTSFSGLTTARPAGTTFALYAQRSGANGSSVVWAAAADDMALMCFNGAVPLHSYV